RSNQAGAFLGISVAGAGDVNNDGYDDVIVGANNYTSGETDEGAAIVFNGGPLGVGNGTPANADGILQPDDTLHRPGTSVAGAGDVNGDGFDDVVVGSLYSGVSHASAFVFLGSVTGIPSGTPHSAAATLGRFNQADPVVVAGAGDTNGDGFDDIVVGASDY